MLSLTSGSTYYLSKEISDSDTLLIFIHGNCHSHKTFQSLFNSDQFPQVSFLSYDLYGHGNSERKNLYNLELLTQQLNEVLKSVKEKKVYLVGHSLGGHIILQSLETLSDKVKGIFCFGTPPLDHSGESPFFPSEAMQFLLQQEVTNSQAEQVFKAFHNRTPTEQDKDYITDFINTDSHFRTQFFPSILSGDFKNEIKLLQKSKLPIELHFGENDPLIDFTYLEKREVNYQRHKDMCHNFHVEQPEYMSSLIKIFLNKSC